MKEGSLFFCLHNIAAGERVNVEGRGQTLINILKVCKTSVIVFGCFVKKVAS